MATYVIRTTIQPDVEYTVDEGEYDRLIALGLLLDGPVAPSAPVFDQTVHDLIENPASLTAQAVRDTAGLSQATGTTTGVLQLAGDLGGTATAPTVTGGTHHSHTASQISQVLTQAAYDAIVTKSANTLYIIQG